jgi:hypothetical protein
MRKIKFAAFFVFAMGVSLAFGFSMAEGKGPARCGYCEGYQVLKKATDKYPPPRADQVPDARHEHIVDLARKIVARIDMESPGMKGSALEYFVKTLAKAAAYDAGNELVGEQIKKIHAAGAAFEQKLKELKRSKQVSEAEAQRLQLAIAVQEGTSLEGQDPGR